MGEEVEGLGGGERVAGGEEGFEVAHLGRGVAADVDHGAGTVGEELGEEVFVAAFARGIDDHGGVGGGESAGIGRRRERREAGEDLRGVASLEGDVGEIVRGGVFAGEADRGFAQLDAGNAREGRRGGEGEEAAAAVGVDEVAGAAGRGLGADVAGEGREDEGVVLEEIAGEET